MSAQQSRSLGATSHPGSTITSRKKNKGTCSHSPGVSHHDSISSVQKLTIPSAYHITACMERESISLTCATLDFPAKYSWNLKTSLRCFHAICPQVKALVSIKWKKHLWNWNTGPPPQLHHRTAGCFRQCRGNQFICWCPVHTLGVSTGGRAAFIHTHPPTHPHTLPRLINWPSGTASNYNGSR